MDWNSLSKASFANQINIFHNLNFALFIVFTIILIYDIFMYIIFNYFKVKFYIIPVE